MQYAEKTWKKYFRDIKKFRCFTGGGETRQHSVFYALEKLHSLGPANDDCVAVHDAARPFLDPALVERLYHEACISGGAAPGIPLIDTVKLCSRDSIIEKHLKRAGLRAIQTPQVFKFDRLYSAFCENKECLAGFTDDTEIFSHAGGRVKMIEGDRKLFKITYKEDLKKAKQIAGKEKKKWK